MKKIFTLTLFLLGLTSALMAQTSEPEGKTPTAGTTYYLYNVDQAGYLSAGSDGKLTIGSPYLAVTLNQPTTSTTADKDFYTLTSDGKKVLASLFQAPELGENASGKYDQWKFTAVSGKTNVYTLGVRTRDAGALYYMYWSDLADRLSTEPFSPWSVFTRAQWKLVSPSDIETQVITLDETADTYTATAITNEATVQLKRTLTQNSWNSFCVPFDIDAAQLKAQFGDDVKVAEFTGLDATTIKFTSATEVKAGTPYLLCPTADAPTDGYYTFTGVTSLSSSPTTVTQDYNGVTVTCHPSFCQTTAPKDAYVLRKNQVYCLTSDMTMKGFRAYFFETNGSSAGANISAWSLDGEATAISDITVSGNTKRDVFNTAGQKVKANTADTDDLPQGVYIVNGKKITK